MKRLLAPIAFLIAIGAAGSALAQNGATWTSGDSGIVTLSIGGATEQPVPATRSPEEMALLFKAACLDTGGRAEAIDSAVADGRLALVGSTVPVKGSKKEPPVQLRLWSGPGVVVARTDGFFAVREAQCAVTFYPLALPERAALAEAMAGMLGAPPSNAAKAVKKDGKPNKHFAPLWTLSEGSGPPLTVNAIAMRGNRFVPGNRVLMAVRPAAQAPR